MTSWWDLGEWSGFHGAELALWRITCPFCFEKGNFSVAFHAEKKKPNERKKLNFDTLECGNCKGYVMTLWSACANIGTQIHSFKVLPWPQRIDSFPEHWPEDVGRYWVQARRNLSDENWDAAALMARSALQLALRNNDAQGNTLKKEIEDLAKKGILPAIMKDWSDNVRELGNETAHPRPGQLPTAPIDAKDIVQFLDFLLEYLYTLPKRINDYRTRKAKNSS